MTLYLYRGPFVQINNGTPFVVEASKNGDTQPGNGMVLVHVSVVDPGFDAGYSLRIYRALNKFLKEFQVDTLAPKDSFWATEDSLELIPGDYVDTEPMKGSKFDHLDIDKPETPAEIFKGRDTPPEGSIRINLNPSIPGGIKQILVPEERFIFVEGSNSQNEKPLGQNFLLLDRYATGDAKALHQFKDWSRLSEEMLQPEKYDIIAPFIIGAIILNQYGFNVILPPRDGSLEGKSYYLGSFPTLFKAICGHLAYYLARECDFPGKADGTVEGVDFYLTDEWLNTEFKATVH